MPKFNNLNALFKYIQKSAEQVMQEIIDDEIIPTMLEVIDREVYNVYIPKRYERRYEKGGLADPTNFDSTIDVYGNTIEISVKNITEPSGRADGYFLDVMIVNGTPTMPMKRDFYEATREVLRRELPTVITEKFAQHGIKVDFKMSIH